MAPRRTYTVSLPGGVTIDEQDLGSICGMSQYDDASDSYSVEFKTWQAASRYQKVAAWNESRRGGCYAATCAKNEARRLQWNAEAATRSKNEAAYMAAELPPPPPPSCTAAVSAVQLQSAEAHINDTGLLLSPPGLNPVPPPQSQIPIPFMGTSTQYVVMLRALPPRLMQQSMLSAMLEQGGLEAKLFGISVSQNRNCGEVEITFSTKDAAELCEKQFHKPKWNPAGTAEIIVRKQGQGGSSKQSAPPVMNNQATQIGRASALNEAGAVGLNRAAAVGQVYWAGGLNKTAPAYVHSMLRGKNTVSSSSRTRTGTSDASTTVSDEEEWCLGELSRELNL